MNIWNLQVMDKVALTLTSLFIGALSTLLITYWRTRYTVKAQDLSKRIEVLCESISNLEDLSCKFWSGDDAISQHYILGYKEKIALLLVYLDKEYDQFSKNEVDVLLKEFFVACTGGGFESSDRVKSPETQRNVLISGEKLKIALMTIRNKLY